MKSASKSPSQPIDSVLINEISSQKSMITLLHSSNSKPEDHPHLYNYWTYNERLRSKNDKLLQRQQASCRLAFYSVWLFIFAGVMTIIVYRFTDECPSDLNTTTEKKPSFIRCSRYLLFFAAISISIIACTGLFYGACRYFHSQPQPNLFNDQLELNLTQNYDTLPINNQMHSCCYHADLSNATSKLPSLFVSNHPDDNSTATQISSMQHTSPMRTVPPFTYEELSPVKSRALLPTPSYINTKPSIFAANQKTKVYFSSSTSPSSSPQSIFSTSTTLNSVPLVRIDRQKEISTSAFEDTSSITPMSSTNCTSATEIWERQV